MRFFKKKKNVVDLGELYRKKQEKLANLKEGLSENSEGISQTTSDSSKGIMGFFGNMSSAANTTPEMTSTNNIESTYERKRKLAKKLKDMTEKIEDLNNQVYHLQQRVELLEKKISIN